MVKPLYVTLIFEYIKEHILERNPTSVMNMGKTLYDAVIFKIIKKNMLERNHRNVSNVVKSLQISLVSEYMYVNVNSQECQTL